MTHARSSLVSFVVIAGALALLGCGQNTVTEQTARGPDMPAPEPAATEPAANVPAQFADARKTFDANCARCHAIGASAGRKRGPNLGQIGAKHDADWLAAFVADPKSKKENSRMPPFGKKLAAENIRAVSEYLASLK